MITCKEITDYISYCESHPNWINRDRWLLINNIVKPLLNNDKVSFDAERFEKSIRYIENNYYPLYGWQRFVTAFHFMHLNNKPIFPKHFYLMGRGSGKDGYAGPLCDYFTTPLYGVREYNVDIVGVAEWQAENTFKVIHKMKYKNPKFRGKCQVTKQRIFDNSTKSEIRFNTSNAKTKDGKQIGALILNEIHAYETYDQINVFESAFGKESGFNKVKDYRKYPREVIITTNGYVREGPLDDILKTCQEILETGDISLGWFPFLCRLDDKSEVGNEDAWHKANPTLEYSDLLFDEYRKEYAEALKIPTKMPEFITKRCNLPDEKSSDMEAVASHEEIMRACFQGETKEELDKRIPLIVPDTTGTPAVIGVDYADIRDFASCGVLTLDDPSSKYIWQQHTWMNSNNPRFDRIKFPVNNYGLPGFEDFEVVNTPVISVEAICNQIEQYMMEYSVQAVVMDTYRYSLFKQAFEARGWSVRNKEHPNGLLILIRKIGGATVRILPLIQSQFASGNLIFGDSAIMRWYTRNTAIKGDIENNAHFVKVEPVYHKNDGFMAFAAAFYYHDLCQTLPIYF